MDLWGWHIKNMTRFVNPNPPTNNDAIHKKIYELAGREDFDVRVLTQNGIVICIEYDASNLSATKKTAIDTYLKGLIP